VLALNALHGGSRERAYVAQPIRTDSGTLSTQLWLATSAWRPHSRLLELGAALVREMLLDLWQRKP